MKITAAPESLISEGIGISRSRDRNWKGKIPGKTKARKSFRAGRAWDCSFRTFSRKRCVTTVPGLSGGGRKVVVGEGMVDCSLRTG